jgi:purine nucleoside permease
VFIGDSFASDYFWHGLVMTQYARDWVRLQTGGKGRFAMTEMEDAGFMNAIERLGAMHRVDPDRVMVLRTASNYSEQRPGHSAADSLTEGTHLGTRMALESAYLCGSTVLHTILAHWDTTYVKIPGE